MARAATASLLCAALMAVAGLVIQQPLTAAPASSPGIHLAAHGPGPHRICPVRNCSAYPDPAKIQGVALSSLENWVLFRQSAQAQIRAAGRGAHRWSANAVRLQLLQDKLVGPHGNLWSPGYFATITHIVNYALRRHLTVILNAQTEPATGWPANEHMPTLATEKFWLRFIPRYGHNPHVVFDLFNEPRCLWDGTPCGWGSWQAGMWPLVRYVRAHGSLNQIWLEGRRWASELAGVPVIPCYKAVSWCQGIVYTFHKPGCPWPRDCPPTVAVWWHQFGYLPAEGVPVVDGEMTNYRGGYYWAHSTQNMTHYLNTLHKWHIGVVAWSLQPGIMTATSSLTSAVSEPQGAGRLFWRYFHGETP